MWKEKGEGRGKVGGKRGWREDNREEGGEALACSSIGGRYR